MRWFWAAYLPFMMCWYGTISGGGFGKFFPKPHFDIAFISEVLGDAKNLSICVLTVIVVILLYVNRHHFYAMLGIDDRAILHWQNFFAYTSHEEQIVLQICVWSVTSDFEVPEESGFLQSCARPGKAKDRFYDDFVDECPAFIRVAYGHNEPQHSRVIQLRQGAFENVFAEVFRVNQDLKEEHPLYIEFMRQELLGRRDLGRLCLEPNELRLWLRENKDRENKDNSKGDGLAKAQLLKMMDIEPTTASGGDESSPFIWPKGNQKADVNWMTLKDLGFQRKPLSGGSGGYVRFAIAQIKRESQS
jgi:hypothetical protein